MAEDKEILRARAWQFRLGMSADEVTSKSSIIIQKLINQADWANVKAVHTYSPIAKLNEVDTRPLIDYLKMNWPRIELTIQSQSQKLPQEDFRRYDLIIVPTLAFDKRLYRLGWGGGFYDRFLAAQPHAHKIGLCFSNGLLDKIPEEPHDVCLDAVVTNKSWCPGQDSNLRP